MPERVLVFHRGALGDSVLLWPMLRAMRERGDAVTLVADGEKARLASRELGIEGLDAEQRRFTGLWAGVGGSGVGGAEVGVGRIVTLIAEGATEAGRVWIASARSKFPGAAIDVVRAPIDRVAALRLADGGGEVESRDNPGGPVVLHVGAGSEAKRWPLARWGRLASALRREGEVIVIAGEVEAERFGAGERREFAQVGGRFVESLEALADAVRKARLFVGCDSGPTHLAAQMGIPTVALFGPTDPARWGPIGPRVRVVGPRTRRGMDWLVPEEVERVLGEGIGGGQAVSGRGRCPPGR